MLIPFRNKKNFSEYVIVGQFKHMIRSRIEDLKQSFIIVFWKIKLKLFKTLTNFAQRYDTRQAYPYG